MGEIVYWNDRRAPRLLRRLPGRHLVPRRLARLVTRPSRNFGDLLGPQIVSMLLERNGIAAGTPPTRRLLTVGSVLHLAHAGDVVWGSGRWGGGHHEPPPPHDLDVRAVRGPLTRDWLIEHGADCPSVFGDPALLLPMLRPDLVALSATKRFDTTYVAHIDERMPHRRGLHSLSARSPVEQMLRTIVQSEFVISTSLHAVIVAEAFGVPARTIVNRTEPEFKYLDHFHATGRPDIVRATSIDDALHLGAQASPVIDLQPLLDAFPIDLFGHHPG